MMEIFKNKVIWTAVLSFITCQILKAILRRDWKAFKSYGGMPSGHTALVVGATLSVGFEEGFSSPCFGFAFSIALVVISDILRLRPKISEEVVHRPNEMIVGGIIGTIWATVIALL